MAATWSSDHSAIYHGLCLRLTIANDLSLVIGFTRIDQKVILMQLGYQFNSYNLMHIQESKLRYSYKWKSRTVLDAPGVALLLLVVIALDLCWLRRFLVSLLCVVYRNYASMWHQHKCNAWGAKCNMLHDHEHLNHINPYKLFTKLPLAFLVF
jgi:hypothetical protein